MMTHDNDSFVRPLPPPHVCECLTRMLHGIPCVSQQHLKTQVTSGRCWWRAVQAGGTTGACMTPCLIQSHRLR